MEEQCRIDEKVINTSVRRILQNKIQRGMWQPVWNMAKEYIDLLYEFENMVKGLELDQEEV